MLYVEYLNGSDLYLYNNGTAVAIDRLDGRVTYFDTYVDAYSWALPF